MKLEIKTFADAGNIKKERLVLRALENIDLGRYVILRSRRTADGSPISGAKDAYWFPDIDVNSGDLVVLYTRVGTPGKKQLSGGRTAHFYYWRKANPFWGDDKQNTAVILDVRDWVHSSPTEDQLRTERAGEL